MILRTLMEARFAYLSKNNNRRLAARWLLVGLVFALAVCLVAGCDLANKIQDPTPLPVPTESPTPSATSTPLVISSADSGEQPTWTVTSTPRRPTALAMTLLVQRDLTQTRPVGSPTSIYTITRTPSITPTWYDKVFPTVTLRKWPTYTFTPRPTYTSLPTLNIKQTVDKLHEIQTATAIIGKTLTSTAMVGNDILVADVPTDLKETTIPNIVFSASGKMPLVVNANWLPTSWLSPGETGLLFEGSVPDHRKLYTLQLPSGAPVLVTGQNSQLLDKSNPPMNNRDNIQPALSPKGDWIAFSSFPADDRSHHHLFIMSSDGKVLYQVTKGIYNEDLQPSWSPDGKKIIFISVEYGYYSQIFTLDVSWLGDRKTSHTPEDIPATPLVAMTSVNTETPPHYCMDTEKPWIVFSARDSYYGARQIYVMKTDGSNVVRLTKDYGNSYPDWSPDCHTLIFVQDQVVPAIYTMDITWLFEDPLVVPSKIVSYLLIDNTSGLVSSPHFSPNGSQVVLIHKNQ